MSHELFCFKPQRTQRIAEVSQVEPELGREVTGCRME